ncbi:MAG: phosphatase PAP2 family protein [Thermoplasmata archaeon]
MADFLFAEGPIRALREASSPFLDALFVLITSTGGILFFLAAVVLIYWLWDKRLGLFLSLLLLVSGAVNGYLKALFGMPRPSPAFHTPSPLTSNGFPSGHAQTSTAFWSGIALVSRGAWIPVAVLVAALVAFSRVYLGVHFIGDVLGGVALGLGLGVAAYVGFRAPLWGRLGVRAKLLLAGLLPAILGGVLTLLGEAASLNWGLLTGLSVGYVLEGEWVGMRRPPGWGTAALRLLLGLPVVAGLTLFGLGLADPLLVLPLFLLVGLAVSLLLPWAFTRVEAFLAHV